MKWSTAFSGCWAAALRNQLPRATEPRAHIRQTINRFRATQHEPVAGTLSLVLSPGVAVGLLVMCGCIASAMTAATPVLAQRANDNPKALLDAQQQRLETFRQREQTLGTSVSTLQQERRKLNDQLVDTARRIQDSESRLGPIEDRLGELKEQETLLRGSLDQQHTQIATLLGSLQRMGRNPPPVMMTHRKDALAMVRSAMLLATAFPGLRDKALALSSQLQQLVRVMTALNTQGEELRNETQRLNDARVRLSGLMAQKKQSLSQQQVELKQVQREAAEISRNVTSLSELIEKLDETVTRNTRLAAHNEKLRQADHKAAKAESETTPTVAESQRVARLPDVPARNPRLPVGSEGGSPVGSQATSQTAPSAKSALSPRANEQRVAILAPPTSTFAAASSDRMEPAVPFRQAKAQLPFPARGKRLLSFNQKTEYGSKSKGIVFQTRGSAQITSPSDGWVVYAGEFRSYGKLLIINAGGGYHILLAGLSFIDVEPGQFILAAEPVGTMGEGPSGGSASGQGPVLYVEFRKSGRPIDPDPWWVQSPQRVQG